VKDLAGAYQLLSKMKEINIGSGHALMRFLERRSTASKELPCPPQASAHYAPLELLSGVALGQMRRALLCNVQEESKSTCLPPVRTSSLTDQVPKCAQQTSSPPSIQSCLDSSKEIIRISTSVANALNPGIDLTTDADLQRTEPRSSAENGERSGATNIKRSGQDVEEVIMKASSIMDSRGRCQASRFCHICKYKCRGIAGGDAQFVPSICSLSSHSGKVF
jgi:hypothetical protein